MSWLENKVALKSDHVSITDHIVLLLGIFHIHFGLLPQPLLPFSGFFLHHTWAFLGFIILHFGRLFTTWLAWNMAESVFPHQQDTHLSPTSSSHSNKILLLDNYLTKSTTEFIYLQSLLGSSGECPCAKPSSQLY